MTPHERTAGWDRLEANAHLEEVQEIIRGEIARGMIRVIPAPDGGVRIIPTDGYAAPAMPRRSRGLKPPVAARSLPARGRPWSEVPERSPSR